MLDVWCNGCNARVLLGASHLDAITNTARGMLVAFRCHRGHRGSELIKRLRPARWRVSEVTERSPNGRPQAYHLAREQFSPGDTNGERRLDRAHRLKRLER